MTEYERNELIQKLKKEMDDFKNYNIKLNDTFED